MGVSLVMWRMVGQEGQGLTLDEAIPERILLLLAQVGDTLNGAPPDKVGFLQQSGAAMSAAIAARRVAHRRRPACAHLEHVHERVLARLQARPHQQSITRSVLDVEGEREWRLGVCREAEERVRAEACGGRGGGRVAVVVIEQAYWPVPIPPRGCQPASSRRRGGGTYQRSGVPSGPANQQSSSLSAANADSSSTRLRNCFLS